jgi:serine/threonine protein kinase
MGKLIGRGGFGTVHKALNVNTGQIVAIKRFHAAKITKSKLAAVMVRTHPVRAGRWCVVWDQSQLTPIARVRSLTLCRQAEADVLEKLNHSNVVKFIGYVKTQDFLHLVLEYVEEGALSDVLKDYGRFPENITALYTAQMLKGLAYLHEQRVIHRDIKGCVKKKKHWHRSGSSGRGSVSVRCSLLICRFVQSKCAAHKGRRHQIDRLRRGGGHQRKRKAILGGGNAVLECVPLPFFVLFIWHADRRFANTGLGIPLVAPEVIEVAGHSTKSDIWYYLKFQPCLALWRRLRVKPLTIDRTGRWARRCIS